MIDLTPKECDLLITGEQRCLCPVGEETTMRERRVLTGVVGNESIFAIAKEITITEGDIGRTP